MDYTKIVKVDILGVTAMIISGNYDNKEFFRCGFYIYNSEKEENSPIRDK